MPLLTQLVRLFFLRRLREIDRFRSHPAEVQQLQLQKLLRQASATAFGKEYRFDEIRDGRQFGERIPVTDYAAFGSYIDRIRRGENNVTWPTDIRWFAKSSGTTASKSKFIPVSREGLRNCHLRGPMDIVCMVADRYPESRVFSGKTLTLGGSHRLENTGGTAQEGDLSAILIENTPRFGLRMRVPKPETALIADFERKVEAICRETVSQNVTSFAGVPSWNLVMLKKIPIYRQEQHPGGMAEYGTVRPRRYELQTLPRAVPPDHPVRPDEIHRNLQRLGRLFRHPGRSGDRRHAADARLRGLLRIPADAAPERSVARSPAGRGRTRRELRP